MTADLENFYRQQLEGLDVEFEEARAKGDQEDMRGLCAVAVTCLLRLAGVP